MKAFLAACLAIVVISLGANYALTTAIDMSSKGAYQSQNVRLD